MPWFWMLFLYRWVWRTSYVLFVVWVKALRSFWLGRDSAIVRRSSVGNKVNWDMVYLYPSCGGLCAYFGGANMVGDQRLMSLALGEWS